MKNFGDGIFRRKPENCIDTTFSHAVTVVGYGTTELGADYYEIRNSYDTDWGNNGYLKIARNRPWVGDQNGILERPLILLSCKTNPSTG